MQSTRTLIVVLFLAVFAVGGFWMLGSGDSAPAAPPPAGANATADPGTIAQGDAAQSTTGVGHEASSRVAAPAPEAGAGAAATGPGIVGQVLDERANAVVGAIVTCTPGFGGIDFDNVDAFDFESAFDTDAWRERLQGAQRERTETTTDGEGRFRLAAAGQGRNLQLRVRAPSHVVLDKNVTRPAGADADLGVLTLKNGATVSGRVLDRSGKPVVGARVSREDAGNNGGGWGNFEIAGVEEFADVMDPDSGASDAEGRFSLPYCAPGKFALRARHPDHPSARLDGLAIEPGATLADLLIVAEPGASIRGRIVGAPDSSKLLRVVASLKPEQGAAEPGAAGFIGLFSDASEMFAGAGMGIGEKQVKCNPDHSFELRGLQVGKTYRIWAAQGGRGIAGNAACTERHEVPSGTAGLELRYDPGITVTFQVVAARTDAPIERLSVKDQLRGGSGGGIGDMMAFMPRPGRQKTYPDGRVTITNLRPKKKQTLSLSIEALGFLAFERKDIALPAIGALDLGTMKLEPAPTLQVTVTSGPEHRAVAGANVRLRPADQSGGSRGQRLGQFEDMMPGGGGGGTRSAKTDAEGRCTLNALPDAAMVVHVTSKEFAPYASEPITLPAGENGSHEVGLLRGGTVEVTVIDSKGASLRDARVEHAPPAGDRSNKQTNQDGVALFEHLGVGEHRFRLGAAGNGMDFGGPDFSFNFGGNEKKAEEPGWQRIAVEDGGKVTLQLAKDPMASLRGIVRENGLPLAGARVSFTEGLGDNSAEGGVEASVAAALGEFGGGGSGNRSARTAEDGAYQLKDLPAGEHRLRVTAKGRVSPTQVTISLRHGENVVDVDLDVTIVRGTVRDGAGQPVAGASVSIAPVDASSKPEDAAIGMVIDGLGGLDIPGLGGSRSSVKTGDDGRYELRGVQAGKPLQVRATAKGHAPAISAVVEVALGMTREGVDIQLGAAGRIKVTVADAPAFATVQGTLLGADDQPDAAVKPVMQMMRRGAATLDGLRPGKWKVTLSMPGGEAQQPRTVQVTAGETATLAF